MSTSKKVKKDHVQLDEKKKSTEKTDKPRKVGRGSKLAFITKNIQNKLIDIISNVIVTEIVGLINDCLAWAVIADTTPDVARHEQLKVYPDKIGSGNKNACNF